jgi:hypothetical protein
MRELKFEATILVYQEQFIHRNPVNDNCNQREFQAVATKQYHKAFGMESQK